MASRARPVWRCVVAVLAFGLLLLLPPTVAAPPTPGAPAPVQPSDGIHGAELTSVLPASNDFVVVPPSTVTHALPSSGRGLLHPGSPFRAAGVGPTPAPAAPAAKGPKYLWGSAYIFYGPSDPQTLLFGQGGGLAIDNALDEFLFFGGQGSGGLSNVTLRYYWWYNATDPTNSSEGWAYTGSPTSPTARTNLSMASYQPGGEALVYGGLTSTAAQRTANDSWIYHYANDTWQNVTRVNQSTVEGPPSRELAAMAVDQRDGIALLFGGIAPRFTSHGSTGAVIWQDTWVFHFDTDRWTQVLPTNVPSARFGASMVWDSQDDLFLMVGGCGLSCTMDVWAWDPRTGEWTDLPQTGGVPSPRASAAFTWDPGANQAILYGGMAREANGSLTSYDDTYSLLPTGSWTLLHPAEVGPAPIYRAPALFGAESAWVNFPDCNVMFISGGDPALASVTGMVYDIVPSNDTPPVQCWWWYDVPRPPSYTPSPCSHQTGFVVTVVSSADRSPIPKAIVQVTGSCGAVITNTDASGRAELTIATPDNLSLAVSATGFHDNSTWFNYTYTNVTLNQSGGYLIEYDTVWLVPYPVLHVQVFGNNGGVFLYPLFGANVSLDNSSVLGRSDPFGWVNSSPISTFNRSATVAATADNYSTSWRVVWVPYTGEVDVTLTILKAGVLVVRVADARSGEAIGGAHGTIRHLDPGLPSPIGFTTDISGRFHRNLIQGNYSVTAWALGYLNGSAPIVGFIPWISNLTLTVNLTPDRGTNVSVRLLDAATGTPIHGGTVAFGNVRALPTGASGWANTTDLGPPGPMRIVGSAFGYRTNFTTIELQYNYVHPPVTLRLSCLACLPGPAGGGLTTVSPFLPTGGSALLLLLIAPAFLVVGGAIYAAALSARRRSAPGGPVAAQGSRPALGARESP